MKLVLLSEIGGPELGNAAGRQTGTTEKIANAAIARQAAFNRFNRQMTREPANLAQTLGALIAGQEIAANDPRRTSSEIITEVLAKSNGGSHLGIGPANVDPDTASLATRVRANEQAWSIIWGLPSLRAKRHALHDVPEGPERDVARRALSLETLSAVVLFNMQEDGLAPATFEPTREPASIPMTGVALIAA